MLAKSKSSNFIDNLVIEVDEVRSAPLQVVLKSEDGKICGKMEKRISPLTKSICWDGLSDLPYGRYTLECTQGNEVVELKLVKRV